MLYDVLPPDPYKALGVTKDATLAEIRCAHRKLVLKVHPDRYPHFDEETRALQVELFHQVQLAYEIISDQEQRQRYDERVKLDQLRGERMREDRRYEEPVPKRVDRPRRNQRSEDRRDSSSSNQSQEPSYSSRSSKYESESSSGDEYARAAAPKLKRPSTFGRLRENLRNPERPRRSAASTRSISPITERRELRNPERPRRSAASTRSISPITERREQGILTLEGYVNGSYCRAIPDTGAERSVIAASFVKKAGLTITRQAPDQSITFRMGNGKEIETIGQVTTSWRFKNELTESYEHTFFVLADCIFDVLIGNDFLRTTQTMTLNRHRLSRLPRNKSALHIRHVNILGSACQRFRGVLDGESSMALPDSGAEPNLISFEYARRRGWLLTHITGPGNLLQFADGSVEMSAGQVTAIWEFEIGRLHDRAAYTPRKRVVFEIIHGCPFDVVLGQDFLERMDAFSKHESSFLDIISDQVTASLNLVIRLGKKKGHAREESSAEIQATQSGQSQSRDSALEIELERRAEADRALRRMTVNKEQSEARLNEQSFRREWDIFHNDPLTTTRPLQRPSAQSPLTPPPRPSRGRNPGPTYDSAGITFKRPLQESSAVPSVSAFSPQIIPPRGQKIPGGVRASDTRRVEQQELKDFENERWEPGLRRMNKDSPLRHVETTYA